MKQPAALMFALLLGACASAGGGGAGSSSGGGGTAVPGTAGPPADAAGAAGSVAPGGVAGTADARVARGAGTADTGAPAQTPAEQRAEIDQRLDDSLGKFDEELRREQKRTAEQRDARAAHGAGTVVDIGTDGKQATRSEGREDMVRNRAGDLRSESASEAARTGEAGDGTDAAGEEGVGGSTRRGGGGVAARAIPSGEDDDIIARRLRKAAETETDPELRDKLWKEYIDYKDNTQGG